MFPRVSPPPPSPAEQRRLVGAGSEAGLLIQEEEKQLLRDSCYWFPTSSRTRLSPQEIVMHFSKRLKKPKNIQLELQSRTVTHSNIFICRMLKHHLNSSSFLKEPRLVLSLPPVPRMWLLILHAEITGSANQFNPEVTQRPTPAANPFTRYTQHTCSSESEYTQAKEAFYSGRFELRGVTSLIGWRPRAGAEPRRPLVFSSPGL